MFENIWQEGLLLLIVFIGTILSSLIKSLLKWGCPILWNKCFQKEVNKQVENSSYSKQKGKIQADADNVLSKKNIESFIRDAINTSDYKYRLEHEVRERKIKTLENYHFYLHKRLSLMKNQFNAVMPQTVEEINKTMVNRDKLIDMDTIEDYLFHDFDYLTYHCLYEIKGKDKIWNEHSKYQVQLGIGSLIINNIMTLKTFRKAYHEPIKLGIFKFVDFDPKYDSKNDCPIFKSLPYDSDITKSSVNDKYIIPEIISDTYNEPIKMDTIENGKKGKHAFYSLTNGTPNTYLILDRAMVICLFQQVEESLKYHMKEIDLELIKLNEAIRNPKSEKVEEEAIRNPKSAKVGEINITDKSA